MLSRLRAWWTGRHDCPRCGVLVPTAGDEFCPSCEWLMRGALRDIVASMNVLLEDTRRRIEAADG